MTNNEMIEILVSEASTNKASNAVFHVWALRERARANVTLTSLYQSMKREGFDFPKAEYLPVLKALASAGIGTLDIGSKGRIRGLKGIRVSLMSIGLAACKQAKELAEFSSRNKFGKLLPPAKLADKPVVLKEVTRDTALKLQWIVDGKTVTIPISKDLPSADLAAVINFFRST